MLHPIGPGLQNTSQADWSRRLTSAVALLGGRDGAQQAIGEDILASLIRSDLGSAQDRQLAAQIMRQRLARLALAVQDGGTPREEVTVGARPTQRETEGHGEHEEPQL